MRKIFAAAALLLVAGVATAQQKFEVTPGFRVSPNESKPTVAALPSAKAPCCGCGPGCGCPPGVCPDGCETPDVAWFSCRITVDRGDGHGSGGSGTLVHSEAGKTLVLTNAHVVPKDSANLPIHVYVGGRRFAAKYLDGSEVQRPLPDFVQVMGPDLALLEVNAELGHVDIADETPPIGAQVWQFGYGGTQFSEGPTVRAGFVKSAAKYVNPTLATSLECISGDSGCGVFNTRGELCGVTWGNDPAAANHCAVDLGTVRQFMGRPLLAKLFPRMSSRASARRESRAAANLPPPMQAPPPVARMGQVDPKLAKPAEGAPKAQAPVLAPFGSGLPPKPPGDGWQYDARKRVWWRYETPGYKLPNAAPAAPAVPPPAAKPGTFNVVPSDCPNGNCPNPRQAQPLFRYYR